MDLRLIPAQEEQLSSVDMRTSLAQARIPAPILTASGCAGTGAELAPFMDLSQLGAVVTKSVMLRPRSGRPTPRMAETPSGMLNSIGLQGPGIDSFIDHDFPALVATGARAVVSIAGGTTDEFVRIATKLRPIASSMTAVEVNISCPNVANRGQVFACNAEASSEVVKAVRRAMSGGVPIFAKLTPDVTDIVSIASACVEAGADGLSMINTVLGMSIDTTTMRPHLGGVMGGLSGPAIRPIAVRAIWQVRQALPKAGILGMGGVRSGADAFELALAGANAISVGTAIFNDPSAPLRIQRELAQILAARGFSSFAEAVSYAHREGE